MKKIIIGITGSIAAYKSAELVRRLREHDFDVQVVMTSHAKAFITPLTLQALSGRAVLSDWCAAETEAGMDHIQLAREASHIICAPASANFIAHLAQGFANDLLSTLCLATAAPITIVPAMNQQMWANPATQHNIKLLQDRNITILGPASGSQACGDIGLGRMIEVNEIVEYLLQQNTPILAGKKILITAGPTHEALDPVRYISNYSSGKMGFALAEAAQQAGAEVTVVAGPVNLTLSKNIKRINVVSAQEMFNAVMQNIPAQDIFIGAAAVADYRAENIAKEKIKKSSEHFNLTLIKNPDILAAVAQLSPKPFTIGFALESENLLHHAQEKLINKNLDLIIANQQTSQTGFAHDTNSVILLPAKGQPITLPLQHKTLIAKNILKHIADSLYLLP